MFSKTCEYGIRAMIFIAQKSNAGNRTGIKEIAKAIDAPEHFIGKILLGLSRAGIVKSFKGPTGGFFLDEDRKKCTLADIVKAIDGDKIFIGCGLGLKNCNEKKPCPIHYEFKKIRDGIYDMLQNARVSEFSANLEKHLTFLNRK